MEAPVAAHLDMYFDLGEDEPSQPQPSYEPVNPACPRFPCLWTTWRFHWILAASTHCAFEATGPAPSAGRLRLRNQLADTGHGIRPQLFVQWSLEPLAAQPTASAPDSLSEDPLETKLALAEEFISIGDEDGARALIEEVMSEATGDMRAKAQRLWRN